MVVPTGDAIPQSDPNYVDKPNLHAARCCIVLYSSLAAESQQMHWRDSKVIGSDYSLLESKPRQNQVHNYLKIVTEKSKDS